MTIDPEYAAETLRLMGLYEEALDARAACVVCGTVWGLVGHGTDVKLQIVDYANATITSCDDKGHECVLHSKMNYRRGEW